MYDAIFQTPAARRPPAEILAFFGLQAHHTVIEVLPDSSDRYLEILAP